MLAHRLTALGHEVSVIDKNTDALTRLGDDFKGRVVVGSGLDEDVLLRAGIEHADGFFAVTRGDNTNLMACQIVKINHNVPYVCAKVADPQRAEAYHQIGLFCINPSALIAGMCKDWLLNEPFQPIDQYNSHSSEQDG